MEDILEVYARPYNVKIPLVCMDESSVQLIGEFMSLFQQLPAILFWWMTSMFARELQASSWK